MWGRCLKAGAGRRSTTSHAHSPNTPVTAWPCAKLPSCCCCAGYSPLLGSIFSLQAAAPHAPEVTSLGDCAQRCAAPPQATPMNPARFGPPGSVPDYQLPTLQASYCPGAVPRSLQGPAQTCSPGTLETTSLWGLRPKVATGAAAVLASATPRALLLMLSALMTWMLMVPAMAAAAPLRSPETVRGLRPCRHVAPC